MTQKNLADKLFVTAQAVSRWENGDVEPSLSTVAEMARIFGVSTDEILGVSGADDSDEDIAEEEEEEEEYIASEPEQDTRRKYYDERPQILALCDKCNNPIYTPADIVRYRDPDTGAKGIRCKACEKKFKRIVAERAQLLFEADNRKKLKRARWARVKNIALALFFIAILIAHALIHEADGDFISSVLGALMFLAFFGTIFFRNTAFGRMLYNITLWHDPVDFDVGILNLVFWAIDIAIWVISGIVALIVGLITAPVFYVFAIIRNIKTPERTILKGFWDD